MRAMWRAGKADAARAARQQCLEVRGTLFSPCRQYRYTLWREWDFFDPSYLMVVGLNPSTADETKDDPTIRRCIGFAKSWGFGSLCMTNLFAWRATDPKDMKKVADPIGPENDDWLRIQASEAGLILAAWGRHGAYLNRANQVITLLPSIHCLSRNKDGSPEHPLYALGTLVPQLLK